MDSNVPTTPLTEDNMHYSSSSSPMSNNKSTKTDSRRRQNLQLQLIQEVNTKACKSADGDSNTEDYCNISASTSASDQVPGEDENQPITRARKVPVSRMLPNLSQKTIPLPTEAIQQNNEYPEATQTSSPKPSTSQKSPPGSAPQLNERQVKYLGLVIEKDDEQIIEKDGECFMAYDAVKR